MNATRRNDPCPCGSGRRYKDCHGRLDAPPQPHALLERALAAHSQGRVDAAERDYRELLAMSPGHAAATHYLGLAAWQRGDAAEAERLMRAALATDASVPDFHNNLGLLLRDTGRREQALDCFRAAIAADPRWIEAQSNLALTLEALDRWDEAVATYREVLTAQPSHATVQQNLARALLATGAFGEAWPRYRWRLLAQGGAARAPDPRAQPWPDSLAGRRILLETEQGIGDVLFFLRFAPEAARRGAALALRCDARLHAMLERTGLFTLGLFGPGAAIPGAETVAIGDLPWLLDMRDAARFPPPLALTPEPGRLAQWRKRLETLGAAPRIALTWRSGVAATGPSRTQLKWIAPAELGRALRGVNATWIAVQRLPRAGEVEELAAAIAAPVHDLTAANSDLEDMLALLSLPDRYVGVSNANTYLRAGSGDSLDVLVAHPPEWRWLARGESTPWFPSARLYREDRSRGWSAALQELRAALA